MLKAKLIQHLKRSFALELFRKLAFQSFFKSKDEIYLFPLALKIDDDISHFYFSLFYVKDVANDLTKQLLGEHHHLFVIAIGAVKLTRSKLRVMSLVYRLVSEVFAYVKISLPI